MIKVQRFTLLGKTLVGILTALLLSSCGGSFFPGANTIVSIALSPASATVKPEATQQFTATATYGNNSTGDVTSSVTWTSSATNVATINSSGLATAVALGTTTITAKSGSVTGTGTMTVTNKTITSITVNPANSILTSGQQQQFTATAIYSDGSIGDISSSVSWSSTESAIATITNTGLVTAVSTGSTTIGASLNGITGTTLLTVE